MPCEAASINEGLDDTWPTSYRPEATMATPSMFGPPAWMAKLIFSCSK
jgi:hypothetical protein